MPQGGGKPMGRTRDDLRHYQFVDTAEGPHYNILDVRGNYYGTFGDPVAAQTAVWEFNLKLSVAHGRAYINRFSNDLFILMDDECLGKLPGLNSEIVAGATVMNPQGQMIWIDKDRLAEEFRVYRG